MQKARRNPKYVGLALILLLVLTFIPLMLYLRSIYFPEEGVLRLPPPDTVGSMPISAAMRNPGFSDVLTDYSMRITEISQLLWAVQGVTHDGVFRAIPSAGGTYPLEIFLVQASDSELAEGYYHYSPAGHLLLGNHTAVDGDTVIASFEGDDRRAISNVSSVFFILAEYSRTTDRYGDRGLQYVHLEVGHAIQNFLLQLASLGLKTRPITDFVVESIRTLLNTSYIPLVALPVGLGSGGSQEPQASTTAENEPTVEHTILRRKSTRDYLNGSIPFAVLSDILNDSRSITYLNSNSSLLDIRIVAGQVDGLTAGIYRYWPLNDSLTQTALGDLREELKYAGLNQPWIEAAQLDLVISVDRNWAEESADTSFAHQMLMISVGMLAQNICLKCVAYGLGMVTVGAMYEGTVGTVVDLPNNFKPIYIMPIGLTPDFHG
ncbi:MAG: SagB family peptide dehydrogenase [Promethearchaeota archaeon]